MSEIEVSPADRMMDAVKGLLRANATLATAEKTHGAVLNEAAVAGNWQLIADAVVAVIVAEPVGDKRKAMIKRVQDSALRVIKTVDGKRDRLTIRSQAGKGETLATVKTESAGTWMLVRKPAAAEKPAATGEAAADAAWQSIADDDDAALLALYARVMARMAERGVKPPKAPKATTASV